MIGHPGPSDWSLLALCRAGTLCDAERWIASGKSICMSPAEITTTMRGIRDTCSATPMCSIPPASLRLALLWPILNEIWKSKMEIPVES